MAMTKSRYRIELEQRAEEAAREAAAGNPTKLDQFRAEAIVASWNAGRAAERPILAWPAIGTAIRAGHPWLQVVCPGCRQVAEVDLRTVDYHPEAPISALIPALSCKRCRPNPPFARLGMLRRYKGE